MNKRYLEKLKEDWWKDKKKCEKVEDQSDGISIQNIGGVFIVIFVGIGFACITLVFEYWWYKYRKTAPQIIEVVEEKKRDKTDHKATDFRNRETTDVSNTILRPRNVNNSKLKY